MEAVGVVEPHREGDDDRCGEPVHGESGLLDGDGLDRVRDLLEGVGRGLELLDDLLELHHGDRVVVAAEQLGQQPAVDLVGLVLEAVDLDPVLVRFFMERSRGIASAVSSASARAPRPGR